MITISFHSIMRLELGCSEIAIARSDITVHDALLESEKAIGIPFVATLVEQCGHIHRPMILVNGRNVTLDYDLSTIVPEGAHLTVLPPVGGG